MHSGILTPAIEKKTRMIGLVSSMPNQMSQNFAPVGLHGKEGQWMRECCYLEMMKSWTGTTAETWKEREVVFQPCLETERVIRESSGTWMV